MILPVPWPQLQAVDGTKNNPTPCPRIEEA